MKLSDFRELWLTRSQPLGTRGGRAGIGAVVLEGGRQREGRVWGGCVSEGGVRIWGPQPKSSGIPGGLGTPVSPYVRQGRVSLLQCVQGAILAGEWSGAQWEYVGGPGGRRALTGTPHLSALETCLSPPCILGITSLGPAAHFSSLRASSTNTSPSTSCTDVGPGGHSPECASSIAPASSVSRVWIIWPGGVHTTPQWPHRAPGEPGNTCSSQPPPTPPFVCLSLPTTGCGHQPQVWTSP